MLRKVYIAGVFTQVLLLGLALLFYKERTVFIDIAFHLFEIARTGTFTIQNYRFAAITTQWLPVAGVKAGLSLDALMLMYSAAFPILYCVVYLLCGWLKQYQIALAFLLAQMLLVTGTFYWIQSELPQGLAFMILSLALLQSGIPQSTGRCLLYFAVLPLLLCTVAFAHPLLAFPFIFSILFLLKKATVKSNRVLLLAAAGIFIICIAVKSHYFKTPYDKDATDHIRNVKSLFPDYFTLYANKRFLLHCLGRFALLPLAGIVVAIAYIRGRQWLLLVLVLTFTVGYLLLVNICFPGPETQDFYIENMYLPLGLFISLPLVYDVVPSIRRQQVVSLAAIAIMLFGCTRIYRQHTSFTQRLEWLTTFWQSNKDEKLIIAAGDTPAQLLRMTWGTPYEFWLLSTSQSGRTASIIVTDQPETFQWATELHDKLLMTWGAFPYNSLPPRYFNFTDSTSHYQYRP